MKNEKIIVNISLYFLCILSLFVGLYFGENSSGGAKHDYLFLEKYYYFFSDSITKGLDLFLINSSSKIHSPVFYILGGLVLKIVNNINIVKIIYILISSVIPYIFYKIILLRNQARNENNDIYFFISLLIFFSPYFRSSAIWLLGDNLSILFFSLFVYYVVKIQIKKKIIKNYFFSCLFLILCCYIRYYYCLYFFVIIYFAFKNLSIKQNIYIFLFSLILSLPFLTYLIFVILNSDFHVILKNFSNNSEGLFLYNYINNIFQIYLIILIYIIPFVIPWSKNLVRYYITNYKLSFAIILMVILLLILSHYISGSFFFVPELGGGIFFKFLSFKIFQNFTLFIFILLLFTSIFFLDFFFRENRIFNYFIFLILILSLPMTILYQKYLDPLVYLLLFGLINSSILSEVKINKYYFVTYFIGILIFANIYYTNFKLF